MELDLHSIDGTAYGSTTALDTELDHQLVDINLPPSRTAAGKIHPAG